MISATPERGYDKALTKRIQRSYKKSGKLQHVATPKRRMAFTFC
jgi:hypothetical protein